MRFYGAIVLGLLTTGNTLGATVEVSRSEYQSRLEGFWLAQTIANWTGRQTEHDKTGPDFYTDANWGGSIDFVLRTGSQSWGADDDTDIEYTYIHLMDQHSSARLTPTQIRDGWTQHINREIWVSNAKARELMGRGVDPRVSGMPTANLYGLRIDAQLTTEVFGALAPGMPGTGLELGLTPMMTTSAGYATHAAQYFAALHSLAPLAPTELTAAEKVQWLSAEARKLIPDSSKTADAIDFVTAEFESSTDLDDWEATRDRIYQRYQQQANANGFKYRGSTESTVNFATGVMAMLYGQGDFKRTVQIGTLSGWDSDNPTATIGGLLGLMFGADAIRDAFPDADLSDLYDSTRTRDNMPDYVPDNATAEDRFSSLAARMMSLIDQVVLDAGGSIDAENDRWLIPTVNGLSLADSPTHQLWQRSANNAVRLAGGTVTANASGGSNAGRFADGVEFDFSGVERSFDGLSDFESDRGAGEKTFTVNYSLPVLINAIRFIEGDHETDAGGWFEELEVLALVDGEWVVVSDDGEWSESLDPNKPFQWLELTLAEALEVTGIRLRGTAGGTDAYVTLSELDAVLVPEPATATLAAAGIAALVTRRRRRSG